MSPYIWISVFPQCIIWCLQVYNCIIFSLDCHHVLCISSSAGSWILNQRLNLILQTQFFTRGSERFGFIEDTLKKENFCWIFVQVKKHFCRCPFMGQEPEPRTSSFTGVYRAEELTKLKTKDNWQDGSAPATKPEFHLLVPHGRKRKPTPANCSLTIVFCGTHTPNKQINK